MLYTLLADLSEAPNPTPGQLGTWLMCGVVILIIIEKVQAIFFKEKPTEQQTVRQSELQSLRADLTKDIADVKTSLASYVTRLELVRIEDQIRNVTAEHKELSKSTQQRYETLAKDIADMRVTQERLNGAIRDEAIQTRDLILAKLNDLKGKAT